jgi:hypothetical protein
LDTSDLIQDQQVSALEGSKFCHFAPPFFSLVPPKKKLLKKTKTKTKKELIHTPFLFDRRAPLNEGLLILYYMAGSTMHWHVAWQR